MTLPSYPEFFERVTGRQPFPYQDGLVQGSWPDLLDIPTGLGKTAAAVVAWLYRRLTGDPETGRRLVYCLPMRVLVEQTVSEATRWCQAATPFFEAEGREPPGVHLLIGGRVDQDWADEPEREAILVGTQDLLLSRALNRGYALSRFKWPIHFGWLNNDCFWVLDETQLMGVAVETSAQLQAFRERLGTQGPARSMWMSATLGTQQLITVDHPEPDDGWRIHRLGPRDHDEPQVTQRATAKKALHRAEVALSESTESDYAGGLATRVAELHQSRGGLTLVILNRVSRAQEVFAALRDAHSDCLLVHSRFRPAERALANQRLPEMTDGIVVATQAVEAGVDISATTLVTELAPWSSLVQRFGRCNRRGTIDDAEVHWVDIESDDKDKRGLCLPYDRAELATAREQLTHLDAVGPHRLGQIQVAPPVRIRPVLRKRDLVDLFDTTADLCGADLDVSRFIRDDQQTDVHLYWRAFGGEPLKALSNPHRDELCAASIGHASKLVETLHKKVDALAKKSAKERQRVAHLFPRRWDPIDGEWKIIRRASPGDIVLLHVDAGGYDVALGLVDEVMPKHAVLAVARNEGPIEAYGRDPDTDIGSWVRLGAHLGHVELEARGLAEQVPIDDVQAEAVAIAGRWHDIGKAHEQFQARLIQPTANRPELAPPDETSVWAKSSHQLRARNVRPAFRHELASALAWLQHAGDHAHCDLIAFLIAAHHGKVRLSIRSLPFEQRPPDGALFARGVWHGDELPATALPNDETVGPVTLDLTPMQLGAGSWLDRMTALRDAPDLGPFRLSYLEALVRIADWRASRNEQKGHYDA